MTLIFSRPADLEHGDRFGKLTVLARVQTSHGPKYRVGCECGMRLLMKETALKKRKACVRCR